MHWLTLAPLENYFAAASAIWICYSFCCCGQSPMRPGGSRTGRAALQEALDIAATYHYIRPVSSFGAAILPLLEKCDWVKDAAFCRPSWCGPHSGGLLS